MRRTAVLISIVLVGLTASAARAGSGAFLGVSLSRPEPAEGSTAPVKGAQVVFVVEDSPAGKAGLQADDLIVAFDGQVITGPGHLQDLLAARAAGDKVEIELRREGKTHRLKVELGESEGDETMARAFKQVIIRSRPGAWLGIKLQGLTPQLAEHFGASAGVLVAEVVEGSPAAAAGLQAGDVIVKLDGQAVEEPDQLTDLTAEKKAGDKAALELLRGGQTLKFEVVLAEPPEGVCEGEAHLRYFSDNGEQFAELTLPDLEQLKVLKLGDLPHLGELRSLDADNSELRAEIEAMQRELKGAVDELRREIEAMRREIEAAPKK